MITNILTIILATAAYTIISFDGNYSTIAYPNANYSPIPMIQENNNYINLTEDFMKEIMDMKKCLKSLSDKIDTAPQESMILESILKNQPTKNKNFYYTLSIATNLLQLQKNIKNERLTKTLQEHHSFLETHLQKRQSLFSIYNPFISSFLTVSVFGILPCIVGCLYMNNYDFIKPSVLCNAGFFTYLWVKKSISLNKKQEAFNTYLLKKNN